VLVPFRFGLLSVLESGTVVDFAESPLGTTVSAETRSASAGLSPTTASLSATDPVFEGLGDRYPAVQLVLGGDESLADELRFDLAVLVGWGGGLPLVGSLRLRRAKIG